MPKDVNYSKPSISHIVFASLQVIAFFSFYASALFILTKSFRGIINPFFLFISKSVCVFYREENRLKTNNPSIILARDIAEVNLNVGIGFFRKMQRENNEYSILSIVSKIKLLELLNKNDIEYLSEYEHLRWAGFYYTKGWSLKEIDLKDKRKRFKAGDEKDFAKQEHMCLCSWRDLEELNKIFEDNKSHTAFDRSASRNLQYLIVK